MVFEVKMCEELSNKAKIKVVGIGGGGGNAVNNMIAAGLRGVEFIAANTDFQDLESSSAPVKIQLGDSLTRGLGAGADPEKGREAAEQAKDAIVEALTGADMVFISAGMGGGTGTGAAPVVARAAREQGALTVGVVTRPFGFEGLMRSRNAAAGIKELRQNVDAIITIDNNRLLMSMDNGVGFQEAFRVADDVLKDAVQGISDIILVPGLINVDFADVRAIMAGMGKAVMGIGRATGEGRAVSAAKAAISSPLLEEASIEGARGVLINVSGGPAMTLHEVNEASLLIQEMADEEAQIIFGSVINSGLEDEVVVTVIATGFEEKREQVSVRNLKSWKSRPTVPPLKGGSERFLSKDLSLDMLPTPGINEDPLDVPAFLRRAPGQGGIRKRVVGAQPS